MNPAIRAFYGALLGALVVLLVHPASRHYLTPGIWMLSDSGFLRETEALPENLTHLPQPDSLEDTAFWLITACESEISGQPLDHDQTLTIVEFALNGARQDPDNAFWRQIEAVFLHKLVNDDATQQQNLDNEAASRKAWEVASSAVRWDDYQTDRLNSILDGLKEESGRTLAWHIVLAESRKTEVHARVLLAYARELLSGQLERKDFFLRLWTLQNGKLMRDGIKTANGSQYAIEMIDLAAYSPYVEDRGFEDVSRHVEPPLVETSRDQFRELSADFRPSAAEIIQTAYKENDAWVAYVNPDEAEAERERVLVVSVLVATVPGTLITIGLIGGAIFLIGVVFSKSKHLQLLLTAPWAQISGLVIGVAVFYVTDLVFPAIWTSIALASFGFRREKNREAIPQGLGATYALLIGLMSVSFTVIVSVLLISTSVPAVYLFEGVELAWLFGVSAQSLQSLAAIICSLVLVSASVWGYVHHYPAERLAGVSIKKFGLQVCLGCLALGVVIAPLSIALDHKYGETALKVFQNEPNYYLTRSQ